MYCTGGIRCERGSAYLKAKVSEHPWGHCRCGGEEGSTDSKHWAFHSPPSFPLTLPASQGFIFPLYGSRIEFVSTKSEVLKSQDVEST